MLVGLEALKAGFGWTDQELYEAYLYNVQVRYALGLHNLGEQDFELRTLYNFRRRVVEYEGETGENLMEQAFEQITDAQIEAFELKTGMLRMDSTQIASNIREMSRLQLLVEVLQRVHRMLNQADKQHYKEEFEAYTQGSSGQYVYQVKGGNYEQHLQAIGELMYQLVNELAATYGDESPYQVLARVFEEQFVITGEEEPQLRPKEGKELSANSLQSPDDWDATYRRKRDEDHIGYVANVTETCDPDNDLQLIVKVQVESNTTDDADMLEEALPELKERTDVEEMHTDGGYNSSDVDDAMHENQVEQTQSAIRGAKPSSEKLSLEDFEWTLDEQGSPQQVSCPGGQTVEVVSGRKEHRYLAYFSQPDCENCPCLDSCPTERLKRTPQRALRFSQQQFNVAQRRKRTAEAHASGRNLRAAIEATVRSVKHPFGNGKTPVRGTPRMRMMLIGSAAFSNVKRIQRYREAQREAQKEARKAWEQAIERAKKLLSSSLYFLCTSILPSVGCSSSHHMILARGF